MRRTPKGLLSLTIAATLAVPAAAVAASLGANAQVGADAGVAGVTVAAEVEAQVDGPEPTDQPEPPDRPQPSARPAEQAERAEPQERPQRPRPSERPAERPERPRPAQRPAAERPQDRPESPERKVESFRVSDAGAVTVAHTSEIVRVVEVQPNRGWRHRVEQQQRDAVTVHFTDGQRWVVFRAKATADGLRTSVHERDRDSEPPERRIETYRAADAGVVSIAVTEHGLRLVQVRPAEGWRHRQSAEPRRIHVAFANRAEGRRVDLVAVLAPDGEVEVRVTESRFDDAWEPVETDRSR